MILFHSFYGDKHTKKINLYSICETLNFHKMCFTFLSNYLGEQKKFSLFARNLINTIHYEKHLSNRK